MKFQLLLFALASLLPFALSSCHSGAYYSTAQGSSHQGSSSYLTSLPFGYSTIYVSGSPFYYHNNYWYRRSNGRYYRTSRPSGYKGSLGRSSSYGHLTRLPSGYRSHTISGSRYYSHGNIWYTHRSGKYYPVSRPTSYRTTRNNFSSGSRGGTYNRSRTNFSRNTKPVAKPITRTKTVSPASTNTSARKVRATAAQAQTTRKNISKAKR